MGKWMILFGDKKRWARWERAQLHLIFGLFIFLCVFVLQLFAAVGEKKKKKKKKPPLFVNVWRTHIVVLMGFLRAFVLPGIRMSADIKGTVHPAFKSTYLSSFFRIYPFCGDGWHWKRVRLLSNVIALEGPNEFIWNATMQHLSPQIMTRLLEIIHTVLRAAQYRTSFPFPSLCIYTHPSQRYGRGGHHSCLHPTQPRAQIPHPWADTCFLLRGDTVLFG